MRHLFLAIAILLGVGALGVAQATRGRIVVSTLNGMGRATAAFSIPAGIPPGTRLYVTAVAFNPGVPGGVDLGNTEVVLKE